MYWVEIRAAVRRAGAPRLLPLAEVDQHRGFRSVYAYDESVVALIREQGGTHDLRGQPVYADELFVDFDSHDPTAFRTWLRSTNLAWEEYDSGNRSVHFHIPLVPVFGVWVPDAMKRWVRSVAPTADLSFYHPSGQYRLPGTYHAKRPGQCKALVDAQMGEPLQLQAPDQRAGARLVASPGADTTPEQFYTALIGRVAEGHRRPTAWRLATMAAEIGMEFEDAVDHLDWWNSNNCDPPHELDVLVKQAESAYRRLARRHG